MNFQNLNWRSLLRPARSLPTTSWSAPHPMVLWPSMRTLVIVLAGNWLFGTGHALAIASGLGVSPWTTLAQGIALQTHWSIGTAVLVLGLVVLALW
ncbi:MAG TPA: hypothetical protein EYM68_08710, partial [Gammaproteobacteria bacterium]|nr:hypothetical protein [Gammaproteobacteria bacterium]